MYIMANSGRDKLGYWNRSMRVDEKTASLNFYKSDVTDVRIKITTVYSLPYMPNYSCKSLCQVLFESQEYDNRNQSKAVAIEIYSFGARVTN